ncbi:Protein of unknown function [Gryllus bimaculatus]|nr:Protein of unknown function [Gryllus bimaculatus]
MHNLNKYIKNMLVFARIKKFEISNVFQITQLEGSYTSVRGIKEPEKKKAWSLLKNNTSHNRAFAHQHISKTKPFTSLVFFLLYITTITYITNFEMIFAKEVLSCIE